MPIGHELEIVNGPFEGLDGEFNRGIGGVDEGIGETTAGGVISSVVGLGVLALALYGFSIYAGKKGWF
jgi:hypothetical protein